MSREVHQRHAGREFGDVDDEIGYFFVLLGVYLNNGIGFHGARVAAVLERVELAQTSTQCGGRRVVVNRAKLEAVVAVRRSLKWPTLRMRVRGVMSTT